MMMIKVLWIKFLLNFEGPQGHVPHQNGMAKLKSVRIMLAIAAFYEIWQMDIKTTFLNGFIKEELYMMQPEGFLILKVLTKCASSSDPFMDWCKPLRVGIYALMS